MNMTNIDRTATVAQIVAEHPSAAAVFEKHDIDYCCHGEVPLSDACRDHSKNLGALVTELETAVASGAGNADEKDVRSLSVPALIARIVDRHHGYLRTALPFLSKLATKVAKAHGDREPQLLELSRTFLELKGLIEPHLDMEERELFPALMAHKPGDEDRIRADLKAMLDEHVVVGDLLHTIRELGRGYEIPDWACNTYELFMTELSKLEKDVLRHIHLENHVLMPRFTGRKSAHDEGDEGHSAHE